MSIEKRLLFDGQHLSITIKRLCHQLLENHHPFQESVILGMQPRGIFFAQRIAKELKHITGDDVDMGYLDITFHRDDFRRRDQPLKPNATHVPFIIEGRKVILIDDVLYTGRSVKAAMDAMGAFGRPSQVELLVLIDRMYSRELPVEPTYIGMQVNTIRTQKILVELQEQSNAEDNIWIVDNESQG